jgi:hypothetical protein
MTRKPHKPPPRLPIICAGCGAAATASIYDIARGRARYCSRHCQRRGAAQVKNQRLKETTEARFWARVSKGGPDECWPWLGTRVSDGYGNFCINGKAAGTHRVAFAFANGREPANDVCHSCDNPPCCNPAHLWEGDARANLRDMVAKGPFRSPSGADSPNAKLTPGEVAIIRSSLEKPRVLAERYGVSYNAIRRVRMGISWRSLDLKAAMPTARQPS